MLAHEWPTMPLKCWHGMDVLVTALCGDIYDGVPWHKLGDAVESVRMSKQQAWVPAEVCTGDAESSLV